MKTIEKTKTKVMKKEKRVKTIPTQEQIDKMVLDYLKTSSKHLFQSRYEWDENYNDNDYFKVIPAIIQGKVHYVKIGVSGNTLKVNSIVDTSWVNNKNKLGMMKNDVFPQYKKHKSVKQYVGEVRPRLSTIFYDIEKLIEKNPEMSKEDIKKMINDENFKIVI